MSTLGFGFGPRTSPAPKPPGGTHRGNVTRVDENARPYVELPRYAPGHEYGPLEYLAADAPWAVGDRVLVLFVEGRGDTPIVLGRLV